MENQREREVQETCFHGSPRGSFADSAGSPLAGLGMHAERVKRSDRMCCTSLKKSQHLKCVNVGNSIRPDVMYFAGDTCKPLRGSASLLRHATRPAGAAPGAGSKEGDHPTIDIIGNAEAFPILCVSDFCE